MPASPFKPHISACGGDFNEFREKVWGVIQLSRNVQADFFGSKQNSISFPVCCLGGHAGAFRKFLGYRIQLSLPRVISRFTVGRDYQKAAEIISPELVGSYCDQPPVG